jgi:hypothetical protein
MKAVKKRLPRAFLAQSFWGYNLLEMLYFFLAYSIDIGRSLKAVPSHMVRTYLVVTTKTMHAFYDSKTD